MKLNKLIIFGALSIFSATASATLINGSTLQNGLNAITGGSDGFGGQTSVGYDFYDVNGANQSGASKFQIDSGVASTSVLLFEFAGYAGGNSFGIYDPLSNASLEIFNGAAQGSYDQGALSLGFTVDGSGTNVNVFSNSGAGGNATFISHTFGYYLSVAATGQTYYSETSKNADGFDHMVAFEGQDDLLLDINQDGHYTDFSSNSYILAWEDLFNGGDQDFADMVVHVSNVSEVPVPATLALFGLGLTGLGFAARKRKQA